MSTPEHVGYVLKRFPRISETFVAAELIELRRQGQQVTVFALSRPAEPFTHAFLQELDVPVVYLPYRPSRSPARTLRAVGWLARRRPARFVGTLGAALEPHGGPPCMRRMRRFLQACVLARELEHAGVDHLHAHFASTAGRVANLTWRLGGPPYSITAHAKDIYHRENRPISLRDKLDHARFVATVCEANRHYLQDRLGVTSTIWVVPNAVDLRRLPTPEKRCAEPGLVLTVARLIEKKGVDDILRACGLLSHRGTPVRLEVVGDGPLRAQLEDLAREQGVDATFAGSMPYEQVIERYRRAAVFALPCVVARTGDRDGLPTAVLEAMAAGVPVVTTAVTGLGELIVDGVTGLVVAERDPEGLADALGRILDDGSLAARIGRAGRQRVAERHDLVQSVQLLRSLFAEAAA